MRRTHLRSWVATGAHRRAGTTSSPHRHPFDRGPTLGSAGWIARTTRGPVAAARGPRTASPPRGGRRLSRAAVAIPLPRPPGNVRDRSSTRPGSDPARDRDRRSPTADGTRCLASRSPSRSRREASARGGVGLRATSATRWLRSLPRPVRSAVSHAAPARRSGGAGAVAGAVVRLGHRRRPAAARSLSRRAHDPNRRPAHPPLRTARGPNGQLHRVRQCVRRQSAAADGVDAAETRDHVHRRDHVGGWRRLRGRARELAAGRRFQDDLDGRAVAVDLTDVRRGDRRRRLRRAVGLGRRGLHDAVLLLATAGADVVRDPQLAESAGGVGVPAADVTGASTRVVCSA